MIKNIFLSFCLICAVWAPPAAAQTQPETKKPTTAQPAPPPPPPLCELGVVEAQPMPMTVMLDEKRQKLTLTTRYGFERKFPKEKPPFTLVSEVTAIVFDDFLRAYNNFLLKRVGPASRCDKLEIGKLQVNVDKTGAANGFFVGRYTDRMCLSLRFFDSRPGDFDRDMFVLYSAEGITGAKNTFRPAFRYGEFVIDVETVYEPIKEPSVFGRGGATLSSLYKERLENFLSDESTQKLIEGILPEKGKETSKSGFKFASAAFIKNREGKIQLTFMLNRPMKEETACNFRKKLLQSGFKAETAPAKD